MITPIETRIFSNLSGKLIPTSLLIVRLSCEELHNNFTFDFVFRSPVNPCQFVPSPNFQFHFSDVFEG